MILLQVRRRIKIYRWIPHCIRFPMTTSLSPFWHWPKHPKVGRAKKSSPLCPCHLQGYRTARLEQRCIKPEIKKLWKSEYVWSVRCRSTLVLSLSQLVAISSRKQTHINKPSLPVFPDIDYIALKCCNMVSGLSGLKWPTGKELALSMVRPKQLLWLALSSGFSSACIHSGMVKYRSVDWNLQRKTVPN